MTTAFIDNSTFLKELAVMGLHGRIGGVPVGEEIHYVATAEAKTSVLAFSLRSDDTCESPQAAMANLLRRLAPFQVGMTAAEANRKAKSDIERAERTLAFSGRKTANEARRDVGLGRLPEEPLAALIV